MAEYFEINENPELGRHSIATKNMVAGEILFEEYPFVVGPKPSVPAVCLVCCYPVDGSANGPRCSSCRWPLCENCIDHEFHRLECKLFVEKKVRFQNFCSYEYACMQLDCITPLRLLLTKESNQKRWDEEIVFMEHHEMSRRQTDQWGADQRNIVEYLVGPCNLGDRFPENLIQQACGILEVNSFEGRSPSGYNVRCIFPKTAIMAHSCVPNTTHTIYPSDQFKIIVRASVDINQGDILYTTYTNLLEGTIKRREHLKNSKFFTCHCKRCSDPTELGTHFSSLKCNKCDLGFICPSDAFGSNIDTALTVIQTEVDYVQSLEFGPERLQKCEQLLHKYCSIFHPLHYIQTGLRQNLVEMYGRVEGYELHELTDVMLEHKIDSCRQVLNLLNILHPGKTRTRAMLLYELHGPLVCMAERAFTVGILQSEALKARLQEAVDLLDECTTILEWEDYITVEYTIAQIGKQSAEQLKETIRTIE